MGFSASYDKARTSTCVYTDTVHAFRNAQFQWSSANRRLCNKLPIEIIPESFHTDIQIKSKLHSKQTAITSVHNATSDNGLQTLDCLLENSLMHC